MANPSKQKGTGGETELRLELVEAIPGLVRTPASSLVDLASPGGPGAIRPVNVLATRPDRGQWLMTMDLETFRALYGAAAQVAGHPAVAIEVKRYRRFSLHTIFEGKFGRRA